VKPHEDREMLADYAQIADGKLFISGDSWRLSFETRPARV
jgi:hypothetical protein